MKKIQQFWIMSLREEQLRNAEYDLSLSFHAAEEAENIVALADNECLRAIRRITKHPYSEERLAELLAQKRRIKRRKKSEWNRALMYDTNQEIISQLYIPEFVCVQTEKKSKYRRIGRKGFTLNGEKYVRLMCGAGHARTNRAMFVAKRIFKNLDIFLRCGCQDIDIIWAKWNAYYALGSSATFQVSAPRVCVVPDKEIEMIKTVDFVTPSKPQDEIERKEMPIKFNLWDGMGIISPELAQRWADELDVGYLPSAYVVRNAFIKGLVCTFDFHAFAAEIGTYSVKDIYGDTFDVRDIDIVMTESMFKLWRGYSSWKDYCEKNAALNWSWGIAKVFDDPAVMKTHIRTNYQFLQVLNMSDDDIAEICEPTVKWLTGIVGNANAMRMYLLGKLADMHGEPAEKYASITDNFIKALLIDEDMAGDDYIKTRVANSINKKIRDAYMGRLIIEGTYQPIMADPYGFCQYIFGEEITGLIPAGKCYNRFYLDKGEEHVCALRSPMTWRSEVNGLELCSSAAAEKWFKYIGNGQIQSLWGVDNMLQSGSDFDGDCVFVTPNECFWRCRCDNENRGVPVTYEPQKAEKRKVENNKLYQTDIMAFDPLIGIITNVSTTIYEIQSQFAPGSAEYQECENRLKLCCTLQSMGIDAAKGIAFEGIPKHWLRSTDDSTEIDRALAINKRRPYFMRYLYPHKNSEYNKFKRDVERMWRISFGGEKYAENAHYIPEKCADKAIYEAINDFIAKKNPLLETKGTMNRLCSYMEQRLKEIRAIKASDNASEKTLSKMFCDDVETDWALLDDMEGLFQDYNAFRSSKMLEESEYNTYEQYYATLNRRAYEEISNNSTELANLAVRLCYVEKGKKAKSFVWDCFGEEVLDNIIAYERKKSADGEVAAVFPVRSDDGEIEYLGKKYANRVFYL